MGKTDQATKTGGSPANNSNTYQSPKNNMSIARAMLSVSMLVISVVLSACSSANSPVPPTAAPLSATVPVQTVAPTEAVTPPPTSAPQDTATTAPVLAPAATSAPQQAAVNTQLDPCELISSQEASTLAGTTYGAGKETTTPDNLKICTYGGQSTNIFTVEVVQAPDVATAQADKAQFLADLQSNLKDLTDQGLNVTQVPNFADGAVAANANVSAGNVSLSGNAFGFLKGTVFFGFSDLVIGGQAPTDAAMQAEATSVLAKLP